jgi:hypothetical protein
METVNVNLAHRWFISYDLDEAVPDHSSLSKIRDRYGLTTFQRFFEQIVELGIEAERETRVSWALPQVAEASPLR